MSLVLLSLISDHPLSQFGGATGEDIVWSGDTEKENEDKGTGNECITTETKRWEKVLDTHM